MDLPHLLDGRALDHGRGRDGYPESGVLPASRPSLEPERPPHTSAGAVEARRVVAVLASEPVEREIRSHTMNAPFAVAGADAVGYADVIVVDDRFDVGARIAQVRARARTDAAIVYVFEGRPTESVSAAHGAGAFACIRYPFAGSELIGLMQSAVDATTAKIKVADLAKQLDLHSHLASIGRMSAGLTHEIANPLSVAIGSLQFIRQEVARLIESERLLAALTVAPRGELENGLHAARAHLVGAGDANELYTAMDDAAGSYHRIEALLTNLRVLIGQGVVKEQRIDLLSLVRDVRRWAAEPLHGVTVEEEGTPLAVIGDMNLLGQIVLNLATNAALAAKSLSAPRVRFHVYAADAHHAIVSIRDNGPGIPEEMHDKIFEPFFTTRRGRGGTGLGLSLCRELARQIGAEISFWSVLGRGTCFRVTLKRALDHHPSPRPPHHHHHHQPPSSSLPRPPR